MLSREDSAPPADLYSDEFFFASAAWNALRVSWLGWVGLDADVMFVPVVWFCRKGEGEGEGEGWNSDSEEPRLYWAKGRTRFGCCTGSVLLATRQVGSVHVSLRDEKKAKTKTDSRGGLEWTTEQVCTSDGARHENRPRAPAGVNGRRQRKSAGLMHCCGKTLPSQRGRSFIYMYLSHHTKTLPFQKKHTHTLACGCSLRFTPKLHTPRSKKRKRIHMYTQ